MCTSRHLALLLRSALLVLAFALALGRRLVDVHAVFLVRGARRGRVGLVLLANVVLALSGLEILIDLFVRVVVAARLAWRVVVVIARVICAVGRLEGCGLCARMSAGRRAETGRDVQWLTEWRSSRRASHS
jgi:hypothetical protein